MIFRAVNSLILASILFLVGVIAFIALEASPSDTELEADISALNTQIKELAVENDRYSGGAIKNLLELQEQILKTSLAMLEQKKRSILRRIDLTYVVEGRVTPAATPNALSNIQNDLDATKLKIAAAEAEVSKYSGGLVQGLALMTVQTEKLSLSLLTLKYFAVKHGLGLQLPDVSASESPKAAPPPGKVVPDKEAL